MVAQWKARVLVTGSKIWIHAFCCALALVLVTLLQCRAKQNDLSLSSNAWFSALSGIQEITSIYPATGTPGFPARPHLKTTHTEIDKTQQQLYRVFDLDRYGRS